MASRHAVVVFVRIVALQITAPGNACMPRGSVGTGQHVGQPQRCVTVRTMSYVALWKRRNDLSKIAPHMTERMSTFVEIQRKKILGCGNPS